MKNRFKPQPAWLIVFIIVLCFGACAPSLSTGEGKGTSRKTADFYGDIPAYEDFMAISGTPLSEKVNDVASVKLVYDLNHSKLFFIHSSRYRYHFDFCREVLGYDQPVSLFNSDNYGKNDGRLYCLANLNYYRQSGIYALEFSSEDEINAAQIKAVYAAASAHSYLKDSLRVLISSGYLLALDAKGGLDIPKVYPSEIYNGQQYQALNTSTATGRLRIIENLKEAYTTVLPTDIIIIKGTPVNVPVCAGIITDMYQTPLSHINVLCHNRNIAAAVQVNIWQQERIKVLAGKNVVLNILRDSLSLQPAGKSAINHNPAKAPRVMVLHANLEVNTLLRAKDFGMKDRDAVGNKAAGVGELYKIAKKHKGFDVPEGAFAIPFYYYARHMALPAIKQQTELLYTLKDREQIRKQLKTIRRMIKDAPVDAALLRDVRQVMETNNTGTTYRFRSSSNAEDMDGFSGAGLYDSKTGKLDDTAKSIDKAIKAVWASAWSDEAFEERAYYHIDHATMMMGVLAHRNFPDEAANGVAVTRNLYRPSFPGFTVNVQTGETSVVSPPDNVTCEQFICMAASEIDLTNKDITADYITYSNIHQGKPVLQPGQITQLYTALLQVKTWFYYRVNMDNSNTDFTTFGLDIEFKFDQNGKLYLKQVRPFN